MTGNNHDRTSASLTLPLAIAAARYAPSLSLPALLIGYTLGWVLLSPDLDLPKSNPLRRWGALGFIWKPYSATHKHRGVSHWPLFGSAERLAYLLVPLGAIAWTIFPEAFSTGGLAMQCWPLLLPVVLPFWVGVEVACLWHLCCDYLPGLRRL